MHFRQVTADKAWEEVQQVIRMWIMIYEAMRELICDQEGCVASVAAAALLASHGIERKLVPKEGHLGLVEVHVLREGIVLSVKAVSEGAFAGINTTVEFGGFTPC